MLQSRPRLFSFGRDAELANLEGWVEDPAERELLVAVVDAFVQTTRTRKLEPEDLDAVTVACRHPSALVQGFGFARLGVLAHYFEEACDRLVTLARDPDGALRTAATIVLVNAPDEARQAVLVERITDPIASVRKAAARVATRSGCDGLADAVRGQLEVEPDARIRALLEMVAEQH